MMLTDKLIYYKPSPIHTPGVYIHVYKHHVVASHFLINFSGQIITCHKPHSIADQILTSPKKCTIVTNNKLSSLLLAFHLESYVGTTQLWLHAVEVKP